MREHLWEKVLANRLQLIRPRSWIIAKLIAQDAGYAMPRPLLDLIFGYFNFQQLAPQLPKTIRMILFGKIEGGIESFVLILLWEGIVAVQMNVNIEQIEQFAGRERRQIDFRQQLTEAQRAGGFLVPGCRGGRIKAGKTRQIFEIGGNDLHELGGTMAMVFTFGRNDVVRLGVVFDPAEQMLDGPIPTGRSLPCPQTENSGTVSPGCACLLRYSQRET